jgi:radical SAM protein with 4Fe4S-binding SPASM domain
MEILGQFRAFLAECRKHSPSPRCGHVTVTGGEPWAHAEFPQLLETLALQREWLSFGILTNGTLIDAGIAKHLRRLGVSFVQVSIEGGCGTHDRVRGTGSYRRATAGIQCLVEAGVRTVLSFTAHRANFREFREVTQLGEHLGVSQVWADRLVPQGTGTEMLEQVLTPEETRWFLEFMREARDSMGKTQRSRTRVTMHRALQFLTGGGSPYQCTAGDSLVTVMPNGDLLPCRRMPIKVGNLFQTPLRDLYDNQLFVGLRDRSRVSTGCQGCLYARLCRGGLKCLSYALTGDPFGKDPGCWYSFPYREDHGTQSSH